MADRFDELRASITAIDRELVALVNARLRLVDELWHIKRDTGRPKRDLERERLLKDALAESNGGPLSPAGLDRLVETVLALMRDELAPKTEA